jgi:hypothetical protein
MERAWRHETDAASFHRRQEPLYVGLIYIHCYWITTLLILLNCEGMRTPISGKKLKTLPFKYSSSG